MFCKTIRDYANWLTYSIYSDKPIKQMVQEFIAEPVKDLMNVIAFVEKNGILYTKEKDGTEDPLFHSTTDGPKTLAELQEFLEAGKDLVLFEDDRAPVSVQFETSEEAKARYVQEGMKNVSNIADKEKEELESYRKEHPNATNEDIVYDCMTYTHLEMEFESEAVKQEVYKLYSKYPHFWREVTCFD